MTIRIKRAYDEPGPDDGARYLVDRLWPRGRKREALELEAWVKEVAPSDELRRWFGHDPSRWEEFRERYRKELGDREDALRPLLEAARRGDVTLVYGAQDRKRNNAVVVAEVLREKLSR